jgi:hypothetical protein
LAEIHHDRGIVAQQRGWLDVAEEHYRRALSIDRQLGDRVGAVRDVTAYPSGVCEQ